MYTNKHLLYIFISNKNSIQNVKKNAKYLMNALKYHLAKTLNLKFYSKSRLNQMFLKGYIFYKILIIGKTKINDI